jgi:uncharacterized protein
MQVIILICTALSCNHSYAEDKLPDLYQISDKDSSIFIFGTMHYLPKGTDWQKPIVKQQLQASDCFVMELDMADPAVGVRIMQSMQQHLLSKDDTQLSESLSNEEMNALTEALSRVNIPKPMIDKLAPGMAIILLQAAMAQGAGFEPGTGAELLLMQQATQVGLDISGLESPEEQLAIFIDADKAEAFAVLRDTLAQYQQAQQYLSELLEAWLADNSAKLIAGFSEMNEVAPMLTANLLVNRNIKWLPKLESYLAENKSAFIAVGAGHVVGDSGLIELLKAKGYQVKVH